jgi:membrane associated rhomboid family serine protease
MLPIGDDNRDRRSVPLVTWALIAANAAVFVFFQGFGIDPNVIYSFSMVPQELLTGRDLTVGPLGPTPIPVYLTVFVSMFMHGGLAHIAGNLWFLSIFGDNVEDRLGHLRFLLFYVSAGVLAAAAHVAVCAATGNSLLVPTLGASGAISGVLGAYLVLFPGNRVRVIVFSFFPATVSAFFAIGLWFVFQVVNGLGYFGGVGGDGVAYAAHIGGFLFGLITILFWAPRRRRTQRRVYYY